MRGGKSGNFFLMPNEVFLLGLSPGELVVYSYLKRCENRKTHQCWPSYKTIGKAVGMSENTVRKYVSQLEKRGLITAEPTRVLTPDGRKRNGNLLYTMRPISEVMRQFYQRQLERLDLLALQSRAAKRLELSSEPGKKSRLRPPVRPCVPRSGEGQGAAPPRAFLNGLEGELGSLRRTRDEAG